MHKNPNEMSFLDHLEELRWHLIRSSLAIVILASVAFIAKDFIFDTIIFGPKKISRPIFVCFSFIPKMVLLESLRLLEFARTGQLARAKRG